MIPVFPLFMFFCFIFASAQASLSDLHNFPDEFQVSQDRALRMFHIKSSQGYLGNVISTSWGILEFYNEEGNKEYVNQDDLLFDQAGIGIGLIDFECYQFKRLEFLYKNSNRIALYTDTNEVAAVLDSEIFEKGYAKFYFRDPETQKLLVTANWILARDCQNDSADEFYKLQDWKIEIVDREGLIDHHITPVHLVWTLLKHSQRHLPSIKCCPYEQDEPFLSSFERTDLSKELPTQFSILQDPHLRIFRVIADEQLFGIVTNSKKTTFDFYDRHQRHMSSSRMTSFYASNGRPVAYMKWTQPTESLVRKTYASEIWTDNDQLLMRVNREGSDKQTFVFRDGETLEPLAIAIWNFEPSLKYYLPWIPNNSQEWSVTILEPSRFVEKDITVNHLVWILMKYSERELPYPWSVPYVDETVLKEVWGAG